MSPQAQVRPPRPRTGAEGGTPLPELSFVHPMPGFPGMRRYALVRLDDVAGETPAEQAVDASLYELRSLERPEIRFLTAVPTAFFPDYQVELDDSSCDDLGLVDAQDAVILVILTMSGDHEMAANLLAPVVINSRTRIADQLILSGSDWPVRAVLG